VLGLYFMFAIKVVQQWEKVAVLRLGRYVGLRGPGIFHIIPIVETLSRYVDQRVRVASVSAESTLTRDTVPVNVDAIVFWLVWNAEKSILEVENFIDAINMSAQTALRESIGRHELAQMITERETMGRELQRILDEKTNPWGITVQSVEIRDVKIPPASKTPCRARRKPSANARPASFSARPNRKSPTASCRPRPPTRKIP
jgi:regulator of protease activity HflC (stomatin/prohibitin superfamily)